MSLFILDLSLNPDAPLDPAEQAELIQRALVNNDPLPEWVESVDLVEAQS